MPGELSAVGMSMICSCLGKGSFIVLCDSCFSSLGQKQNDTNYGNPCFVKQKHEGIEW